MVEMRRTRAGGGGRVAFIELTGISPTSEITPCMERHLRGDRDIPAPAHMVEAMKFRGAMACPAGILPVVQELPGEP
jgi:hypothetical protein